MSFILCLGAILVFLLGLLLLLMLLLQIEGARRLIQIGKELPLLDRPTVSQTPRQVGRCATWLCYREQYGFGVNTFTARKALWILRFHMPDHRASVTWKTRTDQAHSETERDKMPYWVMITVVCSSSFATFNTVTITITTISDVTTTSNNNNNGTRNLPPLSLSLSLCLFFIVHSFDLIELMDLSDIRQVQYSR